MNLNKLRDCYHNNLLNEIDEGENKILLNFIKKREISMGMINHFKYGYSPNTWDVNYLDEMYNKEFIDEVGLVSISEKSKKRFPFFRDRLMFSINDSHGNCIGFSARDIIDKEKKFKFLNSKQSRLYDKSSVLYGQDTNAILNAGYGIVVEGNLDTDRMKASGFLNTSAPCGTSLTYKQILRLKRLTDNIILIFDGDEAGRKAAIRATQSFQTLKLKNPKVVFMPEGEDPDSFIMNNYGTYYKKLTDLIKGSNIIKVEKRKEEYYKLPDDFNHEESKFDMLATISKEIQLKRSGKEYVGICPFHNDHDASLTVNPEKNIWKCFSCGAGGKGAELFTMKYFNLTYKEAKEKLERGW